MIKEVELPKLNSRKKAIAEIIDIETDEVLVRSELTLATVKRMVKYYNQFGIYTRATFNNEEVSA
jgi:hypothetical protein